MLAPHPEQGTLTRMRAPHSERGTPILAMALHPERVALIQMQAPHLELGNPTTNVCTVSGAEDAETNAGAAPGAEESNYECSVGEYLKGRKFRCAGGGDSGGRRGGDAMVAGSAKIAVMGVWCRRRRRWWGEGRRVGAWGCGGGAGKAAGGSMRGERVERR